MKALHIHIFKQHERSGADLAVRFVEQNQVFPLPKSALSDLTVHLDALLETQSIIDLHQIIDQQGIDYIHSSAATVGAALFTLIFPPEIERNTEFSETSVVLSIDDQRLTLWPWEMLYHPDGYFLIRKAGLYRSFAGLGVVQAPPKPSQEVRVACWSTMPRFGRESANNAKGAHSAKDSFLPVSPYYGFMRKPEALSADHDCQAAHIMWDFEFRASRAKIMSRLHDFQPDILLFSGLLQEDALLLEQDEGTEATPLALHSLESVFTTLASKGMAIVVFNIDYCSDDRPPSSLDYDQWTRFLVEKQAALTRLSRRVLNAKVGCVVMVQGYPPRKLLHEYLKVLILAYRDGQTPAQAHQYALSQLKEETAPSWQQYFFRCAIPHSSARSNTSYRSQPSRRSKPDTLMQSRFAQLVRLRHQEFTGNLYILKTLETYMRSPGIVIQFCSRRGENREDYIHEALRRLLPSENITARKVLHTPLLSAIASLDTNLSKFLGKKIFANVEKNALLAAFSPPLLIDGQDQNSKKILWVYQTHPDTLLHSTMAELCMETGYRAIILSPQPLAPINEQPALELDRLHPATFSNPRNPQDADIQRLYERLPFLNRVGLELIEGLESEAKNALLASPEQAAALLCQHIAARLTQAEQKALIAYFIFNSDLPVGGFGADIFFEQHRYALLEKGWLECNTSGDMFCIAPDAYAFLRRIDFCSREDICDLTERICVHWFAALKSGNITLELSTKHTKAHSFSADTAEGALMRGRMIALFFQMMGTLADYNEYKPLARKTLHFLEDFMSKADASVQLYAFSLSFFAADRCDEHQVCLRLMKFYYDRNLIDKNDDRFGEFAETLLQEYCLRNPFVSLRSCLQSDLGVCEYLTKGRQTEEMWNHLVVAGNVLFDLHESEVYSGASLHFCENLLRVDAPKDYIVQFMGEHMTYDVITAFPDFEQRRLWILDAYILFADKQMSEDLERSLKKAVEFECSALSHFWEGLLFDMLFELIDDYGLLNEYCTKLLHTYQRYGQVSQSLALCEKWFTYFDEQDPSFDYQQESHKIQEPANLAYILSSYGTTEHRKWTDRMGRLAMRDGKEKEAALFYKSTSEQHNFSL